MKLHISQSGAHSLAIVEELQKFGRLLVPDAVNAERKHRRMFQRLFFVLSVVTLSQCGAGAPVPSSLLVGNWGTSSVKSAIMEMRLVDDGRRVSGTACGVTSGYLGFTNAPVTVNGRTIEFVVTAQAVIDAIGEVNPNAGNRFIGNIEGDAITGQLITRGGPLNITFNRSASGSGTCAGASRYRAPR